MGAPEGGDAPSVEAKISTATAATAGATPALIRATTATGPMAAMVALAVSGMATATTTRPTRATITTSGASNEFSAAVSCSGSPIAASTLEAVKAAKMVRPMTPNFGAAP